MRVIVLVNNAKVNDNIIRLSITIVTDLGTVLGSSVVLDFSAAAVIMNNRILDQAKSSLASHGIVFVGGDDIKLIGGVT